LSIDTERAVEEESVSDARIGRPRSGIHRPLDGIDGTVNLGPDVVVIDGDNWDGHLELNALLGDERSRSAGSNYGQGQNPKAGG
jgi:hypothetical protein